jgi:hypothetical protein
MKIAHENNPEASCEDLGGLEGQEVIDYLNSYTNVGNVISERCPGGDWAYGNETNSSIPDPFYFCGEDSSYVGCYSTQTLDAIWQYVYNIGITGLSPNPCGEGPNSPAPKLFIEWAYDDLFEAPDCATQYTIKAKVYWYCCPVVGEPGGGQGG